MLIIFDFFNVRDTFARIPYNEETIKAMNSTGLFMAMVIDTVLLVAHLAFFHAGKMVGLPVGAGALAASTVIIVIQEVYP